MTFFSLQFQQASDKLYNYLQKVSSEQGLKEVEEIKKFEIEDFEKRNITKGWKIYPYPPDNDIYLCVCVSNQFPFTMPKIFIRPIPEFLKYPHIEKDGFLCLTSQKNVVNESNIEGIACDAINDALNLLTACFSQSNQADFQDELLSYWSLLVDDKKQKFYSLIDLSNSNSSKLIKVWAGKYYYLFSETEEKIKAWWQNKHSKKFESTLIDALLIYSKITLMPSAYPKNTEELYQFIQSNTDAIVMFKNIVATLPSEIPIVIVFNTKNGIASIGLNLIKEQKTSKYHNGFRIGKTPYGILVNRYVTNSKPQKHNVQRVDPQWTLGRDANKYISILLNKKITIVGCGAIGSAVARLLAQAGVGHINLVDFDNMGWENISRHALGAKNIGNRKTTLLKQSLASDFPHINIESFPNKWHEVAAENQNIFCDVDLIIMTTGEWSADNAMGRYALEKRTIENEARQYTLNYSSEFPPVIYGWAEAFASAGHAMSLTNDGCCFRCMFNDKGIFKFSLTDFLQEKALVRLPACSATFQPFGNIELMPTVSMIAEMTTDTLLNKINQSALWSWLGSSQNVKNNNGQWTGYANSLIETHNSDKGYFRVTKQLLKNDDCPCNL